MGTGRALALHRHMTSYDVLRYGTSTDQNDEGFENLNGRLHTKHQGKRVFSFHNSDVALLSSLFLYNDRVPVRLGNGFKHWHAHVTPEVTAISHRESSVPKKAKRINQPKSINHLRRTFELA